MNKALGNLILLSELLLAPCVLAQNNVESDTNSVTLQQDCNPKVFVIPLPYKKGNAVAADVLEGKTFTNKNAVELLGTMPKIGPQNITPGAADQVILKGYHDGTGIVAGEGNLLSDNIRKGKEIFGVTGTVGLAWGCTPDSGTWDQEKCQTDCEAALNGAYDYICPELCLNINNAFEGFIANTGVIVHKNWFCKGL